MGKRLKGSALNDLVSRVNTRELEELAVTDLVKTRGSKQNGYDSVTKSTFKLASSLNGDELDQLADSLGSTLAHILLTYELDDGSTPRHLPPESDGYLDLYTAITAIGDLFGPADRTSYYENVLELMKLDEAHRYSGSQKQFAPTLFLKILQPSLRYLNPNLVSQALEYAKSESRKMGSKNASQILSHRQCTGRDREVTKGDIAAYFRRDLNGDAARTVVEDLGIVRMDPFRDNALEITLYTTDPGLDGEVGHTLSHPRRLKANELSRYRQIEALLG